MRPGTFDWPAQYAGDTADTIGFTMVQGGVPVVITGAQIRMQVRQNAQADPVLDLSTAGGEIAILDGENGTFRVGNYRNPSSAGSFVYDVEVTFPDGRVKTYFRGSYVIEGEVTR